MLKRSIVALAALAVLTSATAARPPRSSAPVQESLSQYFKGPIIVSNVIRRGGVRLPLAKSLCVHTTIDSFFTREIWRQRVVLIPEFREELSNATLSTIHREFVMRMHDPILRRDYPGNVDFSNARAWQLYCNREGTVILEQRILRNKSGLGYTVQFDIKQDASEIHVQIERPNSVVADIRFRRPSEEYISKGPRDDYWSPEWDLRAIVKFILSNKLLG